MTAPPGQSGSPLRGILWMALAVFLIGVWELLSKLLVAEYSPLQIMGVRVVLHFLIVLAVLNHRVPAALRTNRRGLQFTRAALSFSAGLLITTGLRYLPLADSTAIIFLEPLIVVALAGPFLGERVGWRRWMGVLAGFAGALLIARPGTGIFGLTALFPVAAAVCYASFQVTSRALGKTDSDATNMLYASSMGPIAAIGILPFVWTPIAPSDIPTFLGIGIVSAAILYCMVRAFAQAPASTLSPLIYTLMIWATVFGLIFFGDFPDLWTLAGAAVIVAAGLYIWHRERQIAAAGSERE